MFGNQLVDAAGDTVVDQIQYLAIRVKIQPKLGLVRQLLMQIFDRRRDVQQQQTARTLPHGLLLLLFAVKQADGYAVFFVHQRRVSLDRVTATLLLIKLRQFAKAPDMQIALFQAIISHGRQRLLHLIFELGPQRGQIFAFAQGFMFLTHHAEGHFQMIRHLIPLPILT
ncbi:hypothetical protein D3C80_1432440 [compost metagenome]